VPSTTIRGLALAGLAGGVVALTGCSAVETNGPAAVVQPTPLSDTVVVSQPFCAAKGPGSPTGGPGPVATRAAPLADPGCGPFTSYTSPTATEPYTESGAHRLLVAVQVPDGTPDPELALRRRTDVDFAVDPDVLAAIPADQAAPAGRHWVGYRSDEVRYAVGEENAGDVVDASVEIPRTDPRPSSEPLETTIAIGAQVTDDGMGAHYPADRPVDCEEQLNVTTTDTPDGPVQTSRTIDSTTCPLYPGDRDTAREAPASETTTIVPTDAVLTAPADETAVQAGASATLAFSVAQSGETADPTDLQLRASTTVPGAQASSGTASVPWATPPVDPPTDTTTTVVDPPTDTTTDTTTTVIDPPTDTTTTVDTTPTAPPRAAARRDAADASGSSTTVPVTVAVPSGTPAGVYDVTLRAEDEGGSRTATARLRVSAAPVAPAPGQAPATTPAPATPPPATRPDRDRLRVATKVLRTATVSPRTRRVHLGRVTCVRTKGTCSVRTTVRVGGRTIGRLSLKVRARTSAGVTLRLTRAGLERLRAKAAVATTTVTAAGQDRVVRTTRVSVKGRP
jgi:hypothetical protein